MIRTRLSAGLAVGLLASLAFGTSGALVKPLLDAGWSPAAAVTVRAALAGLLLLPIALRALRGNYRALWRARWRILGMALVGVAGTQLAYFAALERVPVSTALLIEYTAPILLVAGAAVAARRLPRVAVLAGSVVALAGLALVIGPVGGGDAAGYLLAGVAAVGCALYYVIAARPADGLPSVALAAGGLLLGALALAVVGLTGVLPLEVALVDVAALGSTVPWWLPLGLLAVTTAVGYAAGIAASQSLGSRLMSFIGMLEVVFASGFAWLLLGQQLGVAQILGGVLILAGIALVRAPAASEAAPAGPAARLGDPAASPEAVPSRPAVPAGAVTLDPCGS